MTKEKQAQLRYDEDLLESVVFLCATRGGAPAMQIRRFHREREMLYGILDLDERNSAFFRLHLEWFREWGWEKVLCGFLEEFPLLRREHDLIAFRKARGKNEEGAELYVSAETGRNGVIALRAERFGDKDQLARFLRHELTHLNDMVDPAFGYSPDLGLAGQTAAHERLTRERYQLLWDITIDGRLTDAERSTLTAQEHHRSRFDRAYSFWPAEKRQQVFEKLWHSGEPCHRELLQLAYDPRDLASACHPLPGACCPLCGFSTFRWAESSRLEGPIGQLIVQEFPGWTVKQGACGRCLEVYEAALARCGNDLLAGARAA